MSDWPSFDELKQLAQDNPEELEAFRKTQIDKLIENAPENQKHRLRGLQFQIDSERRRHKTPLSRCIAISNKMHESLHALNHALCDLKPGNSNKITRQQQPVQHNATILHFGSTTETQAS